MERSNLRERKNLGKEIFSIVFIDTESLKSLFSFIEFEIGDCPLKISKKSIEIIKIKRLSDISKNPECLSNIQIYTDKMLKYHYDNTLASNSNEEYHGITIEFETINKMIRTMKKKDVFKIFQMYGEDKIKCHIISGNGRCQSEISVSCKEFIQESFIIESKIISDDLESFLNIDTKEFASNCSEITKTKALISPTILSIYQDGLKIIPISPSAKTNKEFGECKSSKFFTFTFHGNIIKALGILKNINTNIIQFLMIDENILRIDISISSWGDISLFLFHREDLNIL